MYNNVFNGILFCNMKLKTIMKTKEMRKSVVVTDGEFDQCLPEYPIDLEQIFTVYIIYKEKKAAYGFMEILVLFLKYAFFLDLPLVFACLTTKNQDAYEAVFQFIKILKLPCLKKPVVQLLTASETNVQNAVNVFFPT